MGGGGGYAGACSREVEMRERDVLKYVAGRGEMQGRGDSHSAAAIAVSAVCVPRSFPHLVVFFWCFCFVLRWSAVLDNRELSFFYRDRLVWAIDP